MREFVVRIPYRSGLHARRASELITLLEGTHSVVTMDNGSEKVNGKSIMGLLTLAAAFDTELKVTVNGSDEEKVAKLIEHFFAHP